MSITTLFWATAPLSAAARSRNSASTAAQSIATPSTPQRSGSRPNSSPITSRLLLRAPLLDQIDHVARARDARRPGLIVVGDKPLEGLRLERGVERRHVSKLIDRIMHAGIGRAPEPPAFLRLEVGKRHRQVMGRVPMVELLPQRLLDHRAHHEIGLGHPCPPVNTCRQPSAVRRTPPGCAAPW